MGEKDEGVKKKSCTIEVNPRSSYTSGTGPNISMIFIRGVQPYIFWSRENIH